MTYLGSQAEDLSFPPLPNAKICVIGAGCWETALAFLARRETSIWGRDKVSVFRILHQDADVRETVTELWSRPIEGERRGLSISIDHPFAMAAEAAE